MTQLTSASKFAQYSTVKMETDSSNLRQNRIYSNFPIFVSADGKFIRPDSLLTDAYIIIFIVLEIGTLSNGAEVDRRELVSSLTVIMWFLICLYM